MNEFLLSDFEAGARGWRNLEPSLELSRAH